MKNTANKENKVLKIILKILKYTGLITLSLIFIVLFGVKVYSVIIPEPEVIELDDEVRSILSGDFKLLNNGYTNYELSGPVDGQAVVLVHGFFMPSFVWDLNFNVFADSGFRVLKYDNFGRGYSDRPETDYNIDLYTDQLYELLEELNINTPVDLIGSSHGGLIIMAFAEKYPELVRKLVLVNPVGFTFTESQLQFGKIIYFFMSAIGIPKIIINNNTLTGFYENVRQRSNINSSILNTNFGKLLEQLQYKGLRHAVYSAVQNLEGNVKKIYENVAGMGKEMLLVWGEKDLGIPLSSANEIIATIPDINYHFLPNDGHTPHVSNPEEFNELVIEFLNE